MLTPYKRCLTCAISDLTTNVVCAQVEKQFRLTESLLNDSKLKKPLKAAIQDAIVSHFNPIMHILTVSSERAPHTTQSKGSGRNKLLQSHCQRRCITLYECWIHWDY